MLAITQEIEQASEPIANDELVWLKTYAEVAALTGGLTDKKKKQR